MTKQNRGKSFENQIKTAFQKIDNVSIDRLADPMAGFAGVKNICDFIVYHRGIEFYIECKTCYGNTLPFTNITENQWQGLLYKSYIRGVVAGVIVWFIDHDVTYFIPIQQLQHLKDAGHKSIRFDTDSYHVTIEGKKKRVFIEYDMNSFLGRYTYTDDI